MQLRCQRLYARTPTRENPNPNYHQQRSSFNTPSTDIMEGWSKLQSSIGSINFAQAGSKLSKGFNSSVQATKERLGQVAADEITELPQGPFFLFSAQLERRFVLLYTCPDSTRPYSQNTKTSKRALMLYVLRIFPYLSMLYTAMSELLLTSAIQDNKGLRIRNVRLSNPDPGVYL